MKTRILFVLLLMATSGLIIMSCNKETEVPKENLEDQDFNIGKRMEWIEVTCTGSCDGPGNCRVRGQGDIFECTCEGCTMQITYTTPFKEPDQVEVKETINAYAKYFDLFSEEKYGGDEILITSIELSIHEKGEAVLFEFENNTSLEFGTVLYWTKNALEKKDKLIVQFDCSGDCNNPGESCRENINIYNGNVECTCEGSCAVEIIRRT